MPDLTSTIEEAAGQPLEAQTDMGRVRARSLDELIEADRYLKENTASDGVNGRRRGLRFSKLVPPGA